MLSLRRPLNPLLVLSEHFWKLLYPEVATPFPLQRSCTSSFVQGSSFGFYFKHSLTPTVAPTRNMSNSLLFDPHKLRMICYRNGNDHAPFEHLLEYDGVRYHLYLGYNAENTDCVENKILQKGYDAMDQGDDDVLDESADDVLELFWPFLVNADAERQRSQAKEGSIIKIQLKTVDGRLQAFDHKEHFKDPEADPVENTFPSLTLFSEDQVERISEIDCFIYKVIIGGTEYCLKTVYRNTESGFIREVGQLSKIGNEHPNIVKVIGVVDAGDGMVDGVVLNFITGIPLSRITSATTTQKEKWKGQISGAISFLHGKGVVWGDAKAGNILIDEKTGDAMLTDFGGGYTKGWVDGHLEGTEEGDLQGLQRIIEYIDNSSVGK